MLFEAFEEKGLSQLSYAVGCQQSMELAIVDPRRDIDIYLDFAEREGYVIRHVLDTHIHADYASGARELAEATGAKLHLSAYDDNEVFEVGFDHLPMQEGDSVQMGNVRIEAMHTPGHTPEHISFLVYDGARSVDVPAVFLTGDFLFVGSLGRPDLLGEEATRGLAKQAFHSVREKIRDLPDGLEIRPGHGAGSACGAGMAGRTVSTLGYEREANPLLDPSLNEDEFIELLIGNLPPAPDFYPRNKVTNSEGPKPVQAMVDLHPDVVEAFDLEDLKEQVAKGAVIIDVRDRLAFNAAHIKGALGIEFGSDLSTWAGWIAPADKPLILVDDDGYDELISESIRCLVRAGQDNVVGFLEGGFESWMKAGEPFATIPLVDAETAKAELEHDRRPMVDLRTKTEWEDGHALGARHVQTQDVRSGIDGVGKDEPVTLVCGSGMRSTVAASLLKREGYTNIANLMGGMDAWKEAGLPVVSKD
ncbi:MBL fold metallo-hydrolase [Guyparkeria sp.]|uniref:MBL fold metallo-hydrolase n=1 Tax=Guyparkeria sp. TaxID=2035736 RepID=UPI0035656BF9